MSLSTGTRIGPYEVLAPLGAGGMGEVFRARDTRLGREVALKTLPPALSREPERLERFEREARAAGALQHPGIVVLFDIGTFEERPYIVTELVDGHSLRTLIQSSTLKPARVLEIATALADALGAAHAQGIVHRDVKPENVLIARDGRVKLVDFGLAKLVQAEPASVDDTSARTLDGTVLGTAAYIAPEQARGEPADHRVDLFALGCVIHEMLTGTSPFHRNSAAETIAAVLKEDPPPLPAATRAALPGLDVLLRRCFEKRAADRFASARDLACALEALRTAAQSGVTTTDSGRLAVTMPAAPIRYRRLTYRRGTVAAARFMPDGPGIVYSAMWEGRPHELFWVFGGATESRPLGIQDATLLGISRGSELAIGRGYRNVGAFIQKGMLARVPLGAGSPRDLHPDVQFADWSPDGQLAVVTENAGSHQIEFPVGRMLYRSDGGWITDLRFSRDGRRLAFLDHPIRGDDAGAVVILDLQGQARRFQHYSGTMRGLAWGPGDREIWFTGAPSGTNRTLRAITVDGEERVLLHVPGGVVLHDVAADGRVLVSHGDERLGMQFGAFDPPTERDLSWNDWSLMRDISRDGSLVLFDESGEGAGPKPQVCIRGTDGSPASRIGEGVSMQFSPDERFVLSVPIGTPGAVEILPVGAGSSRALRFPEYDVHFAGWFPDGRSIWAAANRGGESIRLLRMTLDDEKFAPISEPGVGGFENRATPDGRYLLSVGGDHRLYPIDGGDPTDLKGLMPSDRPAAFSPDGKKLLVFERGSIPARVFSVDLETGERVHWRDIGPSDLGGVWTVSPVRLSADFNRYAYSYGRWLFDLFEVSGLG